MILWVTSQWCSNGTDVELLAHPPILQSGSYWHSLGWPRGVVSPACVSSWWLGRGLLQGKRSPDNCHPTFAFNSHSQLTKTLWLPENISVLSHSHDRLKNWQKVSSGHSRHESLKSVHSLWATNPYRQELSPKEYIREKHNSDRWGITNVAGNKALNQQKNTQANGTREHMKDYIRVCT